MIIFSDDVVALMLYCKSPEKPFIYGVTYEKERRDILTRFKTHPLVSCIGLTKVGDTALDILEANVVKRHRGWVESYDPKPTRQGSLMRFSILL